MDNVIAVDVDGTIVENAFPDIGEELDGAVETLKDLQEAGNKIIIWTCRSNESLKEIEDWLNDRGFKPDAINENIDKDLDFADKKVFADIYIDDRSFPPFTNWSDVREQLLGEDVKFE